MRNSIKWRRIRAKVLKRDKYICHWCGEKTAIMAHHMLPRSEGGTDDLDNLKAQCKKCNDGLHGITIMMLDNPMADHREV